jgi:PAS domain S-box-containing protein
MKAKLSLLLELLREPVLCARDLPRAMQVQAWAAGTVLLLHMAMMFWKAMRDPSLIASFLMETLFVVVLVRILRFRSVRARDKMAAIDKTNLIVRFSVDRRIISANKLFCDISGYAEDDLKGLEHCALLPGDTADPKAYERFWEHLLLGRSHTGVYERVAKDGSRFWLQATYTPIYDNTGNIYEILKIASDFTQQARDAMNLRHKNTYLEHAAKILRHDMHSGINTYMPRGLRSLNRKLTPEIIKSLRISGPLRLLEDGLAHTQKVYEGVKEFTNLVKPGETLRTEELDLGEVLREYLETTSYKRQVAIDRLPKAQINRALFCTAVDNLIRNGIKYNDSDFKMVALTMADDSHLAVIDNGRGMGQEDFEVYSKPYVRKSGQVETGTGLGLNICIAILHEHGFSVSCEKNADGPGTTIKVKIK